MCCKLKLSKRNHALLENVFEKTRDFCCDSMNMSLRALGPLMFLGANVLALTVVLILLFVLTPRLAETSMTLYFINLSFVLWGTMNIYFNYWACALTPAGAPDRCENPSTVLGKTSYMESGMKLYKTNTIVKVLPGVSYRFCNKCSCIKPPRAHHCRYVKYGVYTQWVYCTSNMCICVCVCTVL